MKVRIIVDNGFYQPEYFHENDRGHGTWKPIVYLSRFGFSNGQVLVVEELTEENE